MRLPRTPRVRRKDQIGWSKILTRLEQQKLWDYLFGRCPSAITGKHITPDSLNTKRLTIICELLLYTGIRITELAQLRVKDTPAVLGVNVIEVYRGKNNKDRTIQIAHKLKENIDIYILKSRPKTMPRWIKRSDTSKPLFYSQSGRPYLQRIKVRDKKRNRLIPKVRASAALYRKIRRAGEHAGIAKRVFPHMFRHTFAVNALVNGVDIYMLQQLMGHSDITITARYLHLVNAQLEGLGDKLYCLPK